MKKVVLTLIVLLSLSLTFSPAYARTLSEICQDCTRSSCSQALKKLCGLLGDDPAKRPPRGTPPGGPCCRSCYCFYRNGILHVMPLGDLEVGERYFDEPSGTPWRLFRHPQFDQPSPGLPRQDLR